MQLEPKTVIPVVAIGLALVIFVFRMNRMRTARPLRLEWLWITPALMAAMFVFMLWGMAQSHQFVSGADWAWIALAAAIGGVIGWYRGRMMTIAVDPQTHALNQQASPVAIIFLIGILVVRQAVSLLMKGEAQAWHLHVALLSAAPFALAIGMFTVTRIEMFIRARRLLAEAKAAGPIAA